MIDKLVNGCLTVSKRLFTMLLNIASPTNSTNTRNIMWNRLERQLALVAQLVLKFWSKRLTYLSYAIPNIWSICSSVNSMSSLRYKQLPFLFILPFIPVENEWKVFLHLACVKRPFYKGNDKSQVFLQGTILYHGLLDILS